MNGPASAGIALARMEAGAPADDVASLVEEASAAEASAAFVILVSARWALERGDAVEAAELLETSCARAEERGRPMWRSYYERLGRRWGILNDPDG